MSGVPINSATYGAGTYGATTSSFGSKAVAVSTVGYLCFGLAGWMISMSAAGWFARDFAIGLLFPLSIILAIMGILGFVCGRGLDAIIFFTGATMFSSAAAYQAMVGAGKTPYPLSYLGWFACLFAIFLAISGRDRSAAAGGVPPFCWEPG